MNSSILTGSDCAGSDCAYCDDGNCPACSSGKHGALPENVDAPPASVQRDTIPAEPYQRCAELGQALIGHEQIRRYLEGDARGTVADIVSRELDNDRRFRSEVRERLAAIDANLTLLVQSIRPLGQRLALVEAEVARLSDPPSVRAVGSG